MQSLDANIVVVAVVVVVVVVVVAVAADCYGLSGTKS